MNKITLSCIITLAMVNILSAQNPHKINDLQKEGINEKFNIVKFEPVQLIDPLNTIYLSFEKQATSHTSFQAGIGYIFANYLNSDNCTKLDKAAANIKVKAECRIYCKDFRPDRANWFFAPQFFYKDAIFNTEYAGYLQQNDPGNLTKFTDKFIIQQQEFGIYTKTGFQKTSGNGFVFEFYFGPGLKYVYTKTIGKVIGYYNTSENYLPGMFDFAYGYDVNQNGIRMCFTLGVSIGRCFSNVEDNK